MSSFISTCSGGGGGDNEATGRVLGGEGVGTLSNLYKQNINTRAGTAPLAYTFF